VSASTQLNAIYGKLRIIFGNKIETHSFYFQCNVPSQVSIPSKKSGLISFSYSVGRKFPNLFADALSGGQVIALSAIL